MSKVYIPSIPTRWDKLTGKRVPSVDLNPAERFGELVPLVLLEGDSDLEEEIGLIQSGIKHITEDDYIVAVGDPVLIAAAVTYSHDQIGCANVLRWDRIAKKYSVIKVVL